MSTVEDLVEAISLHQKGCLDKALVLYKNIISTEPKNQVVVALMSTIAQSHYQLAQLLMQMGRIEDSIESLNNVLSVRNDIPDAHFQLGQLYIRIAEKKKASEHLRNYLRLVPDDKAGAKMLLAHLGEEKIPENAPQVYLQQFYENYANTYDHQLINQLDYKCPQVIRDALIKNGISNVDILDLGCGTGLSGEAVISMARILDGVDLSEAMLNVASQRNIYNNLEAIDVYDFLGKKHEDYDVVIAAGLFEHIGAPDQIFQSVFSVLRNDGCFVFTADENLGQGVGVNSSGFFTHGKDYLIERAKQCGFRIVSNESVYMRRENNNPVSGLLVVLKKK